EDFVVVCLESITDKGERNQIVKSFTEDGLEIIDITREQLEEHYAGNMLNVCNNDGESILVMSERAKKCLTAEQTTQIEKYATIVAPTIYQIEDVGGGSARCMMAEIFLPEREE
ncbi:MAG: arginine deiminase-related protein, partial [Chitinophagales bacterium]